ncbi:gas vesicle protein GvpG [Halohasta litorea]|uniref:Gas vesicle protein GvpG n=1 Tax=Halohasta litorea TaxID=869891 RepID=A0ABD6D6S7_9EURY|nr:gas vesicle protein GvpG [Halohasta litorea]
MFVIDDLLINPFVSIMEAVHSMAISELYDTAAIKNEIKENRLLYELGERSEAEYERRNEELETQLEIAREAHEQTRGKVEVMR